MGMLQDPAVVKAAIFTLKRYDSNWSIIFVGRGNKELLIQKKRVCEIFGCGKNGCIKCFEKLKNDLLKMFNREVEIICLDKDGKRPDGIRKTFEKCHFFELVTDNYSGEFCPQNPVFEELSDNIQENFKKANRTGKKTKTELEKELVEFKQKSEDRFHKIEG